MKINKIGEINDNKITKLLKNCVVAKLDIKFLVVMKVEKRLKDIVKNKKKTETTKSNFNNNDDFDFCPVMQTYNIPKNPNKK